MVSFTALLTAITFGTASVMANHVFTLNNRCAWGVNVNIDNWSGNPYTGPQPPTIGAYSAWSTTIPDGWDGRICDNRNCWGANSLTEFNLNAGGLNYYDISNIRGFTVGQAINVGGCQSVACTNVNCPCDQAYPPGNTAGTCPGSGTLDRPVRACGSANIEIVYCP